MPRTKEQFEAMRMATLAKIHKAAMELFSKKGLAGTTVQEIADTAQISIGLLYRHYKTKDDIFGALAQEAMDGLGEVEEVFNSGISPYEAIQSFSDYVIEALTKDDEFVQYMILISQLFIMNQTLPWMRELLERDLHLFSITAAAIKKGQDLGQCKKGDPKGMAQHFFSVIQGVCTMKFYLKDQFIPPTTEMLTIAILKTTGEGNHESE